MSGSSDSRRSGGPPRFFALTVTPTGTMLAGTCGRGISRSEDDGRTWTPVEGPGNGFIHDFASEPDGAVLAATGGTGLYRSRDDGRTWTPVGLRSATLYGLAVGRTLHVGTEGAGVRSSHDGGNTWTGSPALDGVSVYRVMELQPNGALAATEDRGVWRLGCDGWEPSGLDDRSVYALVDLGDAGVLAGTKGDGVHRSRDGGQTWSRVGTGLTDPVVHTLVATDGVTILAGTGRGVHRSVDGGQTWEQLGDELSVRRIFSIAATSAGGLIAGSYDGVWRSEQDGASWIPVDTGLAPGESFAVAVGPGGLALAGGRSGALVSHDAGASWTATGDGLDSVSVHAFCWTSTGEVLAGTADGVRATSDVAAAGWQPAGLGGRWVFTLLEVEPGLVLAGTLGDGLFVRDGSTGWEPAPPGSTDPLVYDLTRTRAGTVLAATGAVVDGAKTGAVFRSLDGGRTWARTDHDPITVYRVVQDSHGYLYAGAQRCVILRSTDDGATWERQRPDIPDDLKMFCMAIDRTDHLYLAAGALLLRSDDGASTFGEPGDDLDGVTVYDIAELPDGALLAATSVGMFISADCGATWVAAQIGQGPTIDGSG